MGARGRCVPPIDKAAVTGAPGLHALAGLRWLGELQNRDGGWPTFCRGWGKLPFDRSGSDLTAHALRALRAWIQRRSVAARVIAVIHKSGNLRAGGPTPRSLDRLA